MSTRWIAVIGFTAFGCSGGGEEPTPDQTTWDDLAPIVEARCSGCHQPGGISPFSLLTFADAAPWAEPMALAVEQRTMPPWLVVSDGTCGDFAGSEWLTDEEIATFVDWAADGAPAGAADSPLTPADPPGIDRVDFELTTPETIPEAEGDIFAPNDEYRCAVFENPAGTDIFLTGYEIVPGVPGIVHHVLGIVVDPDAMTVNNGWTNREELAYLEAVDPRPGWDCLGAVGGDAREKSIPVNWAPGQGGVEYPDGMGIRLRASEVLVVQVHYNLVDPAYDGLSDSTSVLLRTAPSVEQEAFVALPDRFIESLFDGPPFDAIPPGEDAYVYQWELSARGLLDWAYIEDPGAVTSIRVHSVGPHMHQRGLAQKLVVLRDGGGRTCAADVPRWDFEWQRIYFYEEPLEVSPADTLQLTCTYDTSTDNGPILPGWGTKNEMCLMGLVVTVER